MKRRGYENLTLRLAKRECLGVPPGSVTPQSRRLAENVVPDTPLPGLVPPPNTVLSFFTPCGRYLIAFQPVSSEVVAFRFKGLHVSTGAAAGSLDEGRSAEAGRSAAGSGPAPTVNQQQVQQAPQQQLQGSESSQLASQLARNQALAGQAHARLGPGGQAQHEPAPPPHPFQRQHPPSFADIFEEHWRCCPCPGRLEQVNTDFCAVPHGRFLLVCTASAERPPPAGATGAAELVPSVERTTFHLVELDSGCLLDSHTLLDDFVELGRSQGAHLWGQLLLVLGLASQTLHVLQVLPAGRFLYLHAIGQYCRDDDALVIAQQEETERRLRQQQERLRRQQLQRRQPALNTAASAASLSRSPLGSGAAAAGAGPSPTAGGPAVAGAAAGSMAAAPQAAGPFAQPASLHSTAQEMGPAGRQLAGPGGGPQQSAGVAPPAAAAPAVGGDWDSDGEELDGHPTPGAGLPAGELAAPALLGGLKQCLLAYLFREAQQQSQSAAAAAAAAAAPSSEGGHGSSAWARTNAGPRGLAGAGGSTASLLSAVAAHAHGGPAGYRGLGGCPSGSNSAASLYAAADGAAPSGAQQQQQAHLPRAHWRRPLDRFCYYFQAYCELVMWKAQVLDEQRLMIHWCPPEALGGPHHRHGHGASAAAHGAAGSYVMLYNLASASVERLFVAHSSEFAAWYLAHPAAFCGGSCACGCGSQWERCMVPPGASRVAREQQQRDAQQATQELRHRLADELPASSQTRQATPYLDPDLYCFDERAVGGPMRPHHPPHRSIKFMCRCQPERLRFRLDPEHLAPPGGPAGSRAAAARARHLTYLFHPVQPFLLVVSQDIENGTAEHLTVFTRL